MEKVTVNLIDLSSYELMIEAIEFAITNHIEPKKRKDYQVLKSDILKGVITNKRTQK